MSVDTRRATTENAPISHFCETRKDSQPVLADSSHSEIFKQKQSEFLPKNY